MDTKIKTIAKTVYTKGYWLTFQTGWAEYFKNVPSISGKELENDIQIILSDDKGKRISDATCRYGSYGVGDGEWEVMSDDLPKNWGDSVMGYLTWTEVMNYFDKSIRRLEREKSKPNLIK